MNPARKRRPQIARRARAALLRRIYAERKNRKKGEDVRMPSTTDTHTRAARVYVALDAVGESLFTTSFSVDMPVEGATKKFMEMQKNGFWVKRAEEMIYVAPNQIRQIAVYGFEGEPYT